MFAEKSEKQMGKTCTIYLYGDIAIWSEASARNIAAQVAEAERTADELVVRVHSYGGSVIEGNMIINALRNCRIPVTAYVDGIAASMAAMLLTAVGRVYMSENALLMLHAPAACCTAGRGTAQEHAKTAAMLESLEDVFVKALAARTGKSKKTVKAWMTGDNWFSARQAMDEGLVDGIVDAIASPETTPTPQQAEASTVEQVYAMFGGITASAALAQGEATAPEVVETIFQNDNHMEISKQIAAALGVGDSVSDEQIVSRVRELHTAAAEAEGLRRKVEYYEKQEAERFEAQCTALVTEAEKARKITASERERWLGFARANYEDTKAILSGMPAAHDLSESPANTPPADPWKARLEEIERRSKQSR